MEKVFAQNNRLLVLQGIAAVAFGILVLVWPGLSFVALLALFGAFALITGVFELAKSLNMVAQRQTNWVYYLLGGVAGVAIGAVTFLWPGWTALTLVYLIGFWAIATGAFAFVASIEYAGQVEGDWMLGLSGILSVAFGVLVALYPRSGAFAIIWLIGFYAILTGVTELMLSYRLSHGEKQIRSAFQHSVGQS